MDRITAPHSLGQDEAYGKIKTFLSEMKKEAEKKPEHKIKIETEKWYDDSHKCEFKISAVVRGISASASGTLTVNKSNIELSAEYSNTLAIFRKEFEASFLKKANELLKRK